MPPNASPPDPSVVFARMLEEISRIAPDLSLQPGSGTRDFMERTAREIARAYETMEEMALSLGPTVRAVETLATSMVAPSNLWTPRRTRRGPVPNNLKEDKDQLTQQVYAGLGLIPYGQSPSELHDRMQEIQRLYDMQSVSREWIEEQLGIRPGPPTRINPPSVAHSFVLGTWPYQSGNHAAGIHRPSFTTTPTPTAMLGHIAEVMIDLGFFGKCEMSLEEMQKLAAVVRTTAWTRLLKDEYPY